MRDRHELLVWTYVAEIAFFVAHSVDSTRFAEWELFGMTQTVYVSSYLPFMAVMLWALVMLVRGRRAGVIAAGLLGFLGLIALAVHGPQLVSAAPAFHTPESVALIAGLALTGTATVVLSGLDLAGRTA